MSNSKDFFADITDPQKRAALVAGFLSAHGVPGGREELAQVKEDLRRKKTGAAMPEPQQG